MVGVRKSGFAFKAVRSWLFIENVMLIDCGAQACRTIRLVLRSRTRMMTDGADDEDGDESDGDKHSPTSRSEDWRWAKGAGHNDYISI
jgi:predicted lipid-binding transport protein (Tim44 family)